MASGVRKKYKGGVLKWVNAMTHASNPKRVIRHNIVLNALVYTNHSALNGA